MSEEHDELLASWAEIGRLKAINKVLVDACEATVKECWSDWRCYELAKAALEKAKEI